MVEVSLNGSTSWYPINQNMVLLMFICNRHLKVLGYCRCAMRADRLVGVQTTKCYGSTNPVNVVRATVNALKEMESF